MQKAEIQYAVKQSNEERGRFISIIREIPYVALPSERPNIICFAERIEELSGYDADEILADREQFRGANRENSLFSIKRKTVSPF
jgi:hypothetical protein